MHRIQMWSATSSTQLLELKTPIDTTANNYLQHNQTPHCKEMNSNCNRNRNLDRPWIRKSKGKLK